MSVATTFRAAALEVLQKAGRPLTADEVADEALRLGLLSTAGKTPRRTMSACLYVWTKDNPHAPVERVFQPGTTRARRGTVRWRLRDATHTA